MSGAEATRRILRAALRRSPTPFEQRLALGEYERIETERRQAEVEEIAAYHGVAGDQVRP